MSRSAHAVACCSPAPPASIVNFDDLDADSHPLAESPAQCSGPRCQR